MRAAAALVVVVVGCGRGGFEPTAPAGMIVQQTASEVVVLAPDRFRLVFHVDYDWQPVGWFDLASDPERNLVAQIGSDPSWRLLQGLLVRPANEWLRMSMGTNRTIAIERPDPQRVRVTTAWRWTDPSRVLEASIVHDIDASGTWMIDAAVSDPTGNPGLMDVEYADAHVTTEVAWIPTRSGPSYEFVARDLDPPPALRVTRQSQRGSLSEDESNNAYWALDDVSLPLSLSWTASIWQPEP